MRKWMSLLTLFALFHFGNYGQITNPTTIESHGLYRTPQRAVFMPAIIVDLLELSTGKRTIRF